MRIRFFLLAASLFLLAGPAQAANVTVGCPGSPAGTYDFTSIQDALNAVDLVGPHTITVTGTCTEGVYIQDRRNVTIVSAGGYTATVVAPDYTDTVYIERSQNITLQSLVLTAVEPVWSGDVVVANYSQAAIRGCTITGTSTALWVFGHSTAAINNTTIENNSFGVYVQDTSRVTFTRRNRIANNADTGVYVIDLSEASFSSSRLADGTELYTTIENHTVNGLLLARNSLAVFGGSVHHKILNTGDPAFPDGAQGIFVTRNSTLRANYLEISGTYGSGLWVQSGSNAALTNSAISNNMQDGVTILLGASAEFLLANSVTGNGGASVSCDESSLVAVYDVLEGAHEVRCKNIMREVGPMRPGRIDPPGFEKKPQP